MNAFFSSKPFRLKTVIAVIRMVLGLLLIYHGLEVFDRKLMEDYLQWDQFKGSVAELMVYAGKLSELVAGILLFSGFLTRVGALLVIGTFMYITFFVGEGRFWYQDQHPFMFALFGLLFLFVGPGAWSFDSIIFTKRRN